MAKEEPASDLRDALALSWWAATSVPCLRLVPLLGTSCDNTYRHYQVAAAGYFRVVCQEAVTRSSCEVDLETSA